MKIVWTRPALENFEKIIDFIAEDSLFFANKFSEQVFQLIEKLTKFPKMGKKVIEEKDENIRELVYNHYRIIYEIKQNEIIIYNIIHGKRNISDFKI